MVDGALPNGHQFVWQVAENAGFEACWLEKTGLELHAEGRTVGQLPEPYWLTYTLDTDEHAVTTRLTVTSMTPTAHRRLDLRNDNGTWSVDGVTRPDLTGAQDCDLAYSPLTNTMPMLRTGLHRDPGTVPLLMAFVEVPSLRVVPSQQTYTHLGTAGDAATVRFAAGSFTSDLLVDADGMVVVYPTMARLIPATARPDAGR